MVVGIRNNSLVMESNPVTTVSTLNATDEVPMTEIPLFFVFVVCGFGVGGHFIYGVFGVDVLTLLFCSKISHNT